MTPPWFFCPQLKTGRIELDDAESLHALGSLRLRPGEPLVLFDGQGHVAHGTLLPADAETNISAGRKPRRHGTPRVIVEVEHIEDMPPASRTLTLLVAGCKGPRLAWLVEKCTELGVTRIVLADFERSVVRAGEAHVEKLRRTAIEACKQCGRAWLPEITAGDTLPQFLTRDVPPALLLADPGAEAQPLAVWLAQHAGLAHVAVVIGPEGGLTPAEIELCAHYGAARVRLAEHVLRVETAALAVAANWAAPCET